MMTTSNNTAGGAGAGCGMATTAGPLRGIAQLNFVPSKRAPKTERRDDTHYRRYVAVAYTIAQEEMGDSPGSGPTLRVLFGACIFRIPRRSGLTFSPKKDFANIASTATARLNKRPASATFRDGVSLAELRDNDELIKTLLRRAVHPTPSVWCVGGVRVDKARQMQLRTFKDKIARASMTHPCLDEGNCDALVSASSSVAFRE